MNNSSKIEADKIRAYMATDYSLNIPSNCIILNIGKYSSELSALYKMHNVTCGALITAYNPYGKMQSDTLNEIANQLLFEELHKLNLFVIEGSGSEPGTDWPAEISLYALGLNLDKAREIGNRFNQDAIVWTNSDAIPQLVLLR